jgi:predicted nucleotidyltransferase
VKTYGPRDAGIASVVLRTLPGKILSHWVFQGMLGMDRTEALFKIGLNTACIALAACAMPWRLSIVPRLMLATALGQTVGLVVDAQLPVVAKWHGGARRDPEALLERLDRVAAGLLERRSVLAVIAFGSASRGELHAGSDIDVCVLRRPGLRSGIESCSWVALERLRATADWVPLDIYVWDGLDRLDYLRPDEPPLLHVRPGDRATVEALLNEAGRPAVHVAIHG